MSSFYVKTQIQSFRAFFLIETIQSNSFPELQAVQLRGTTVKPTGARMEARASTSGTRTSVSALCATEGRTVSKVGYTELAVPVMCAHVTACHCHLTAPMSSCDD